MNSVLHRLYEGNIFPEEQLKPRTEAYRRMREKQFKHYDEFIEKLKSADPILHEQFIGLLNDLLEAVPLETSEIFIDGFRLGVRIMAEVYQEDYTDLTENNTECDANR